LLITLHRSSHHATEVFEDSLRIVYRGAFALIDPAEWLILLQRAANEGLEQRRKVGELKNLLPTAHLRTKTIIGNLNKLAYRSKSQSKETKHL